jgi:hypothetical protein
MLPTTIPNFNTIDVQNAALIKETGKTLHELFAEAVEFERQKMLAGGDVKQYVKLLTTVFGKFSIAAPQHIQVEEITKPLTREEIKQRIDNYLTRRTLSSPVETE